MADQSHIQSAASKSIRPFRSSEEYLYAMKEDLAEWLNALYDLDVTADTFLEGLETGCALCRHANNVTRAARDFQRLRPDAARLLRLPASDAPFQARNVAPGSFLARDNVSNFIAWCRRELWIQDVLMFETNDLVERCNEKNFVLCLLEVARRGAKFGMLAPMLVQLEEEIEEEIRDQGVPGEPGPPSSALGRKGSGGSEPDPALAAGWQQKRVLCDMRNLDELVREILGQCSCPSQFPMTKVSEGKYKVGDSSALIFIRVLRTHVMVRVGGGWDTLEHYLDKHDPCRCAAFAHRYQQAKPSGQGPHSKSSSAHSSRSTSPGPHWRNEGIAPYKTPDRRSLEPSSAFVAPSSSSRAGRPSLPVDLEPSRGRPATLMPRPPRDRSEPRYFSPLRNKDSLLPLTRRLSGDSDSSTASSKCGSGGGAGGRMSLGARTASGEEVVLLVNRKEGKHVIERPAAGGGQIPSLRTPQTRARSVSRERPANTSSNVLKPSPPQGPADARRGPRTERGRSSGQDDPRRIPAPRSQSQGKMPFQAARGRPSDPQAPRAECQQDPRHPKQATPASPRIGGGISRRPISTSASSSPAKGASSNNSSPAKKGVVNPRPPAPRSPSGARGRLLPPVSQPGRRSPHSSPRSSNHHHHHPPRSPRSSSHGPRNSTRSPRGWPNPPPPAQPYPQDELPGLGFGFQPLPSLDPQREQDLFRCFEAEFLANTQLQQQQQARVGPGRNNLGKTLGVLQAPGTQLPQQLHRLETLSMPPSSEPNVTDSAYSSSNSSTSSLNTGGKHGGQLPDLRDPKRSNFRPCALEDPPTLLHSQTLGSWNSQYRGLKKLPAISSSMEEGDLGLQHYELPLQPPLLPRMAINGTHPAHCRQGEGTMGGQPESVIVKNVETESPLDDPPDLSHDLDHKHSNENFPPLDCCMSPVSFPPPPEEGLYQDSSSESSSMCFSMSEPPSEGSSTPPPPIRNGDGEVVLRPKRGQKKAERVPSIYKLKLRPRIRPRTDNRPENSPSRIPTPVSYREQQPCANLSPLHTPPQSPHTSRSNGHAASRKALHQTFADLIHPQSRSPSLGSRDCSYSPESSLDAEDWM
ncbi:GAS2-like protein 1 [Denticeps clupeoides]|uniref:Uncharacterized protein n=1 Tax=Denticeps clupeoides TaxID=299321 RepID=A0AAY4DW52_9TELE|nr:GAS2-like protein 1 [Denticeps clupeoides]